MSISRIGKFNTSIPLILTLGALFLSLIPVTIHAEESWSPIYNETGNSWSPIYNETADSWSPIYNETSNSWSPIFNETNNSWSPIYNETNESWSPIFNETSNSWSPIYNETANSWSPIYNEQSWSPIYNESSWSPIYNETANSWSPIYNESSWSPIYNERVNSWSPIYNETYTYTGPVTTGSSNPTRPPTTGNSGNTGGYNGSTGDNYNYGGYYGSTGGYYGGGYGGYGGYSGYGYGGYGYNYPVTVGTNYPSRVTLNQVPYTGLMTNMKVVLFGIGLTAWSALMSYLFIIKQKMGASVLAVSALGATVKAPAAAALTHTIFAQDQFADAITTYSRSQNVLLSTDALDYLQTASQQNEDTAKTLIQKVLKNTEIREDAWTPITRAQLESVIN